MKHWRTELWPYAIADIRYHALRIGIGDRHNKCQRVAVHVGQRQVSHVEVESNTVRKEQLPSLPLRARSGRRRAGQFCQSLWKLW